MSRTERKHNFSIRLYADRQEDVKTILEDVNHYAFILHDKDVYRDDTEDHCKGDKKKPHYHICVNFAEKQSLYAVHKKIKAILPNAGERVEFMKDPEGAFLYLTHSTEEAIKEEKYRYPDHEVVTDNADFWSTDQVADQVFEENSDYTVRFVEAWIEGDNKQRYALLQETRKQHGRDFILNCGKIISYADFEARFKQEASYQEAKEKARKHGRTN